MADANAEVLIDLESGGEPVALTIVPAKKTWGGEATARMTPDQADRLADALKAVAAEARHA